VVQRPVVRAAPEPPSRAAGGGGLRELPPEKQILEILRVLAVEDPVARSLLDDVREQVAEMLRIESLREW